MNKDLSISGYDFTKIPFDDIISFGQRSLLYRDLFTVSWLLGRYCNYKCSYCWPYARSDNKDHRPTELVLSTIDEIKRQARENKFNSFHFSFSGGEPTFHPGYLDILKYLADDAHITNYSSIHMTSNCSRTMKWFEKYVEYAKPFHRASITASLHTEHVDSLEKKQEFADKLIFCQENDVQVTINMVMVPEWFDKDWENALFFHEQGINVTLKPQSDPTASRVVDGYTEEQLKKLWNGMPQMGYTEIKRTWNNRPKSNFQVPPHAESDDVTVPTNMQIELIDKNGKKWYMDQAERFNAFNFNQFKGWNCNAGYQGIIIREPDGSIKRSYSCKDVPLGNIETGFKLFNSPTPCISNSCVSSADSKIPKRII
jgi:organic radical activating enzyme